MDIFNFYANSAIGADRTEVEPLFESWITGEDTNELNQIANEVFSTERSLSEGAMLAESMALVCSLKGDESRAEALQEASVKDYFTKFIEAIKKAFAKVKAFFARLLKSIAVKLLPVKKAFKDINKYLKKDFSKFEYTITDWTDEDMAGTISDNSLTAIEIIRADIMSIFSKTKSDQMDSYIYKEKKMSLLKLNGILVGASGDVVVSVEEAVETVKDRYGASSSKVNKTGLPESESKKMVDFVLGFENNKAIKKLKEKTTKLYTDILNYANKTKTEVEKLLKEENNKSVNKGITEIKNQTAIISTVSGVYNRLMGTCIKLERQRFSEYRAVLSSAVRYSPKKSDN